MVVFSLLSRLKQTDTALYATMGQLHTVAWKASHDEQMAASCEHAAVLHAARATQVVHAMATPTAARGAATS